MRYRGGDGRTGNAPQITAGHFCSAFTSENRQTIMNLPNSPNCIPRPSVYLQDGRLYLLRPNARPGKAGMDPTEDPKDRLQEATADAIVCRRCLHIVTFPTERRMIDGAHTHTFANPEGIIFEIGCYHDAQGCGYIGPSSSEFTWFAGYVWRIAICGYCHVHLGWRFTAGDGHFFHGLITSRLITKAN